VQIEHTCFRRRMPPESTLGQVPETVGSHLWLFHWRKTSKMPSGVRTLLSNGVPACAKVWAEVVVRADEAALAALGARGVGEEWGRIFSGAAPVWSKRIPQDP
jgi:hypothetical protein